MVAEDPIREEEEEDADTEAEESVVSAVMEEDEEEEEDSEDEKKLYDPLSLNKRPTPRRAERVISGGSNHSAISKHSNSSRSSTNSLRSSGSSGNARNALGSLSNTPNHSDIPSNSDRPALFRSNTGDSQPRSSAAPTRKMVTRSLSGDNATNRRNMMSSRAMSSRDFGTAGGRGFGGGRGPGGRGLTRGGMAGGRGRGRGMPQKSMSTRFVASTRALFNLESFDEPDPTIIMYMGRELKGADLFDEDWIQDALDEEAGLKSMTASSRMGNSSRRTARNSLMMNNSSNNSQQQQRRRSSNNNDDDGSDSENDNNNNSDSEGSEVSEAMPDDSAASNAMEDDSKQRVKRRANRRLQSIAASAGAPGAGGPTRKRPQRHKSFDPSNIGIPPQPAKPTRKTPTRSKTFDGTKTSEILPRRRKPKVDPINNKQKNQKPDLLLTFQTFLAKGGAVVAAGRIDNNFAFTQTEFPTSLEPRRHVRPTSKKKKEQFQKLEYTPQDINDVLFEDDETFQRLKRVLTKKGAITNGVLQQRLHIFLKKAKDRQSKLIAKRKEEAALNGDGSDDDENDPNSNIQSTQPDWAAMSMMDMFAHSVRKLTVTNDNESPDNKGGGGPPPPKANAAPPAFQRRALPRAQMMMAKKSRMAAQKKSSKQLMIAVEEDEEEEDTERDRSMKEDGSKNSSTGGSNHNNDDNSNNNRNWRGDSLLGRAGRSISPPPVRNRNPPAASPARSLTPQSMKATPIMSNTSGHSMASSSQQPSTDMDMELAHLMLQPKCLDDELTESQRPMELDMSQTFQQPPEGFVKCIDDESTRGSKPLKLDLNKRGNLLVEPKNINEEAEEEEEEPMIISGRGARRTSRGPRVSATNGTPSGGRDRRRRGPRAQPSTDRRRSSRSPGTDEDVPNLQAKSLDGSRRRTSTRKSSSSGRSSTSSGNSGGGGGNNKPSTPPPPGLLVGWNH